MDGVLSQEEINALLTGMNLEQKRVILRKMNCLMHKKTRSERLPI